MAVATGTLAGVLTGAPTLTATGTAAAVTSSTSAPTPAAVGPGFPLSSGFLCTVQEARLLAVRPGALRPQGTQRCRLTKRLTTTTVTNMRTPAPAKMMMRNVVPLSASGVGPGVGAVAVPPLPPPPLAPPPPPPVVVPECVGCVDTHAPVASQAVHAPLALVLQHRLLRQAPLVHITSSEHTVPAAYWA